jgi:hypothetical protein
MLGHQFERFIDRVVELQTNGFVHEGTHQCVGGFVKHVTSANDPDQLSFIGHRKMVQSVSTTHVLRIHDDGVSRDHDERVFPELDE